MLLFELPRDDSVDVLVLFDDEFNEDPKDEVLLLEALFDEPRDEVLLLEMLFPDDPNELELLVKELLFEVLLLELPYEEVLLVALLFVEPSDEELFDELLLFDDPYEELLLFALELLFDVELLFDELLLLLLPLLLLFDLKESFFVSFLKGEELVVLYSLSDPLFPPLFDHPEEPVDSSDEEDERPVWPLLMETTFTWVAARESRPSSEESLLKLMPLEFRPVLPATRVRLALRLEDLMVELLFLLFN